MNQVVIWGVFSRALGLVACIHFASLAGQLRRLIGSNGVEPAQHLLNAVKRDLNPLVQALRFPSLFLINSSDRFIVFVCSLGLAASIGIVAGAGSVTPLLFLVCWICWLSIQTANPTIFSFPWDILLNECLLFGALLPPLAILPNVRSLGAALPAVAFYFNWLLFRVIFGMGFCKFKKLGETERDLTYIFNLYEWQPMPTPLAYYMRALPMWMHKVSFGLLFVVEVVAVFGIFGSPLIRLVALAVIAALQIAIWATGNYGSFNLLTLVLCIPLLFPLASLSEVFDFGHALPALLGVYVIVSVPSILIGSFWTTTFWVFQRKAIREAKVGVLIQPIAAFLRFFAPFRLFNSYGVFEYQDVYRRDRLQTRIQGTDDGVTWRDYDTKFLTGRPTKAPRFFAPYHPRLDFFLFYGLGEPHSFKMFMLMAHNPYYFHPFCLKEKLAQRLLRNEPSALSFFENNPFPERPPSAVRFVLYKYKYTTREEKAKTGAWWKTTVLGVSENIHAIPLDEDTGINGGYCRFISETLRLAGVNGPGPETTFENPLTGATVIANLHAITRQ
jgi:hypothetical protein